MAAGVRRRIERVVRASATAITVSILVITGCAGPNITGTLEVQSLSDQPVLLSAAFTSAVFTHEDSAETSFWLSDVPVADLLADDAGEGQIVHVELLWRPRAGSTPMDSSATNASIRYVVVSHGEVGVYVGAGYATPHGSLDASRVRVSLHDASLRLSEATDGFRDLLGPAQLSGSFVARSDPEEARRIFVSVSQHVTDALGRTRFVLAEPTPAPGP